MSTKNHMIATRLNPQQIRDLDLICDFFKKSRYQFLQDVIVNEIEKVKEGIGTGDEEVFTKVLLADESILTRV